MQNPFKNMFQNEYFNGCARSQLGQMIQMHHASCHGIHVWRIENFAQIYCGGNRSRNGRTSQSVLPWESAFAQYFHCFGAFSQAGQALRRNAPV